MNTAMKSENKFKIISPQIQLNKIIAIKVEEIALIAIVDSKR